MEYKHYFRVLFSGYMCLSRVLERIASGVMDCDVNNKRTRVAVAKASLAQRRLEVPTNTSVKLNGIGFPRIVVILCNIVQERAKYLRNISKLRCYLPMLSFATSGVSSVAEIRIFSYSRNNGGKCHLGYREEGVANGIRSPRHRRET